MKKKKEQKQKINKFTKLENDTPTKAESELISSPYVSTFKPGAGNIIDNVSSLVDNMREKIFEGMGNIVEKSITINQKYCDDKTEILQRQVDDLRTMLQLLASALPQNPSEKSKKT